MSSDSDRDVANTPQRSGPGARRAVAAIIAAVTLGVGGYEVVREGQLQQTSALFVGLPALMAIVVVLFVAPQSAAGVALKAVTIGLLLSMTVLDEGMMCVLLSAPLFYLVTVAVVRLRREWRDDSMRAGRRLVPGLIGLTLLPLSLEGVTPYTTVPRLEEVTVSRIVDAPAGAVAQALLETPRFDRTRPALLRHGFPWPEASRIDHDGANPSWLVAMRGGETRLNGMEPKTGELRLDLVEARPGRVEWRAVADTSHMTHFLRWQGSTVHYSAIDREHTQVTWTIRYERRLDPAWYFGPMERLAVRLAAGYLVDAVATP